MSLLDILLRSSAVLVVGLLSDGALARRSAALRHCVLAAAIVASFATIPLSLSLPGWDLPISAHQPASAHVTSTLAISTRDAGQSHDARSKVDWRTLANVMWAAGFLVTGSVLLLGIGRLLRVSSRAPRVGAGRWTSVADRIARSYGLRRDIALLQTDAPDLLATWGLFTPRVLLPSSARDWTDDRLQIVLCHELAHIQRNDWLVQIGAEAVRTVFWFNPLIWIACTRLRRQSEQACDDVVLGERVGAREYASHLLQIARQCRKPSSPWASAMPMARSSTLERRIAAMLNPALDRSALSRRSVAATIVLLMLVTLPISAFRAAQTTPASLTGSVYDTTGAVLPGVTLTLENAQEQKQQVTTRADGRFDFPQIAPGNYVLSAALPGFRALKQEFELKNSRDWDRAITLQVGEVNETVTVQERRVTGPVGASQPQMAQRLRVGGNIRAPLKTADVHPIYPKAMRDAGREGVVPLEAIIGPDGSVTSVRVLTAQIHPDFAIAAADAVRQWKFTPTLLNGAPVEVVMKVSIQFRLSD